MAQRFYTKPVWIELDEAIVSFTFDDVPQCGFENGVQILSKYGFSGTFYVALGFMENQNEEIFFRKSTLLDAVANHHEIGCHTYSHLEFYDTDYLGGIADLTRNQNEFYGLIPGYKLENFSYPFGHQTFSARKIVRARFRTARGNDYGINLRKIDLNNLRTIRLYEQKYTEKAIRRIIDKAVKLKAWLIFYTHDIQARYSKQGCTPAFFESVVKKCHDENIRVLPVGDVVNTIVKNGEV